MKKSVIIKAAAIILMLVLVVASAVMVNSDVPAECTTCEGTGLISGVGVCEDCKGVGEAVPNNYYATFVSLVPPLVAIILALVTKGFSHLCLSVLQ